MSTIKVYDLPGLGVRSFFTAGSPKISELAYVSHKHAHYEMHIMLEGRLTLEIQHNRYQLEPGQFCLIAPGLEHIPRSDLTGTRRHFVSFEPNKTGAPLGQFLIRQMQTTPVYIGSAATFLDTVAALQAEQSRPLPFFDESVQLLLSRLLLETARVMKSADSTPVSGQNSLDEARFALIDAFLNNNFHLSAGEELLAKELGVSCRQLDRILKKQYGKGFREKVREVRMEAAASLLKYSDKSVREISEKIGYSTPSNFISFFRAAFGVTPLEYRKQFSKK